MANDSKKYISLAAIGLGLWLLLRPLRAAAAPTTGTPVTQPGAMFEAHNDRVQFVITRTFANPYGFEFCISIDKAAVACDTIYFGSAFKEITVQGPAATFYVDITPSTDSITLQVFEGNSSTDIFSTAYTLGQLNA